MPDLITHVQLYCPFLRLVSRLDVFMVLSLCLVLSPNICVLVRFFRYRNVLGAVIVMTALQLVLPAHNGPMRVIVIGDKCTRSATNRIFGSAGRQLSIKAMPIDTTYILYDIPGTATNHQAWSPNVWKTRCVAVVHSLWPRYNVHRVR
jgi:hypothetical protein